ncbi:hypothetical protein [Lacunimicrobium album]
MVSWSADLENQLDSFIKTGAYSTREEVIAKALDALNREQEEIAAILAGFDDIEAGEDVSLEDVDQEMRKKYGIGSGDFAPSQFLQSGLDQLETGEYRSIDEIEAELRADEI